MSSLSQFFNLTAGSPGAFRVFPNTGSVVIPANKSYVTYGGITSGGGSGGGNCCNNNSYSGGGGGGSIIWVEGTVTCPSAYTACFVVGAGGAGGAVCSAGGSSTSSVSGICVCTLSYSGGAGGGGTHYIDNCTAFYGCPGAGGAGTYFNGGTVPSCTYCGGGVGSLYSSGNNEYDSSYWNWSISCSGDTRIPLFTDKGNYSQAKSWFNGFGSNYSSGTLLTYCTYGRGGHPSQLGSGIAGNGSILLLEYW